MRNTANGGGGPEPCPTQRIRYYYVYEPTQIEIQYTEWRTDRSYRTIRPDAVTINNGTRLRPNIIEVTYDQWLRYYSRYTPITVKITVMERVRKEEIIPAHEYRTMARQYTYRVMPPDKAEVWTNWTVTNTDKRPNVTQRRNTLLQESVAATTSNVNLKTSTFICAPNPVSNYNNRQIYTDVAIAGTKERPANHTIDLVLTGGGVAGEAEWCKTIPITFTINGNMYEDFTTVDRLP
jgi:hypothetical protein